MNMNHKDPERMDFYFDEIFNEERCQREPDVFLYFQNLLSNNDKAKFERHLRVCSNCGKQLSDLQKTERIAESTELGEEKAKPIFERNLLRLQEYLDQKHPAAPAAKTDLASIFTSAFRLFSLPAYANVAIAALLVILVYPAYRGFILNKQLIDARNELSSERSKNKARLEALDADREAYEEKIRRLSESRFAPKLSGSEIKSIKPERSGRVETIEITFNRPDQSFNLLFSVQGLDYETYAAEILKSKAIIWRDEIKPRRDKTLSSALIALSLQGGYFKAGEYRLVIYGQGGKPTVLLEEYNLRIN